MLYQNQGNTYELALSQSDPHRRKRRFLCICTGGNVRSVALAQLIKEKGHEAIAIGEKYTTYETATWMLSWANIVVDVREYLPEDIWHNPRDPDLQKEVKKIWKKLEAKLHSA